MSFIIYYFNITIFSCCLGFLNYFTSNYFLIDFFSLFLKCSACFITQLKKCWTQFVFFYIKDLLHLCTKHVNLTYSKKLYIQIDGVVTGLPLGSTFLLVNAFFNIAKKSSITYHQEGFTWQEIWQTSIHLFKAHCNDHVSSWNQSLNIAFNIFSCRILIISYKMLIKNK